jgi:lipopolysaccharide transport system permease protein
MQHTIPGDHGDALVIRPCPGWVSLQLGTLWEYRELLYFLVWRDLKVRYKQTLLGALWIVVQPVISMLVFSILFGRLLGVPSGNVPYPILAFAALLPWSYFASSLNRSSSSLVFNAHLVTKIYFPRLLVPIAAVVSGLVDFGVSFLVLIGLMGYYGILPTAGAVLLPVLLLLAIATALGFGLWLAALNVRFRDVNYVTPYIIQVWMYLTPVIYGSTLIPQRYRYLIALNPMTGVVEGFRWALLGQQLAEMQPLGTLLAISTAVSLLVLAGGIVFFRRTERSFADII